MIGEPSWGGNVAESIGGSGAIVVDYVACFSFALSVDITLVHFWGDVIRNTSDLLVRLTTQFSLGRPGGSCLLGRQLCCQCLALGMAFSGHDVALGERRLPTACFSVVQVTAASSLSILWSLALHMRCPLDLWSECRALQGLRRPWFPTFHSSDCKIHVCEALPPASTCRGY